MTEIAFGQPLPSGLQFAVSFGIPTWDLAIGYVEKRPEVVTKMATGYPRYFPQPEVQKLCDYFIKKYAQGSESCRPFPSYRLACKCLDYVKSIRGSQISAHLETESFILKSDEKTSTENPAEVKITIAAILAMDDEMEIVKEFWKLRGECVSSRLAATVNRLLDVMDPASINAHRELEADIIFAKKEGEEAKKIIRKRVAENHCQPFGIQSRTLKNDRLTLTPDKDVYLVSSGMSSIFAARDLLSYWERTKVGSSSLDEDNIMKNGNKTLCETAAVFGFPFKDTKVIMENFGTCKFFGHGNSKDVTELKKYLETDGQRILGVFVETPSNPLLNMPDLRALRKLADQYGFFVVVDDTIGGLNVDILPYADVVCTSLTKLFSGTSNVMGGSIILNPGSRLYSYGLDFFKSAEFEDLLWCQDAITLEINSRDFEERTLRANENTQKLLEHVITPEVGKVFKKIYFPNVSSKETFINYEAVRNQRGGYGCMFSLAFYAEEEAELFFNSLKIYKGPSNGTNFTLACPYVHLAHHFELEDVSKFGADSSLVRVSVGQEDSQWQHEVFFNAIDIVRRWRSQHP
ncbi:LAFE_0G00276g1_1 [Lachancea fermentati]|uniref:LAFE_0G00276g1_1 n=1 Tax=Lachancea fermentati TaxID=4955 RepID=A0A1G4MGL6_LACFM|nr:LAFE_0G00276g1_1 [Lachancea fermentati]